MDLPFVARLLNVLAEKVDQFPIYYQYIESLLLLAAVPPMLRRSSEALWCRDDLKDYFSFLGYFILCLRDENLRLLTLEAIQSLLERKSPVEICCISLKMCQETVENSKIPEVLTQLLEVADAKLFRSILKVILHITSISHVTCQKVVHQGAVDHLLLRLWPNWTSSSDTVSPEEPSKNKEILNLDLTIKILWVLLKGIKNNCMETFRGPNKRSLWSLRYALHVLLKSKGCEINRNCLMGILLQCLQLFPDTEFVLSRLADDVALLSVATENGTGGSWASELRFTAEENDYIFKKMLLHGIRYCIQHDCVKVLLDRNCVPGLLRLITPKLSISWHPQQHCKLIELTMDVLQELVLRLSEQFLLSDGPLRLLMIIEYYIIEPFELSILKATLRCIFYVACAKNDKILDDLWEKGAVYILNSICDHLLSQQKLTLMTQNCVAYAFCTLEVVCRNESLVSEEIVNLCIKYLERVVSPRAEDPVHDPIVLICALDFLWESVVWCDENLKMFVTKGGVFRLLDVIQKSAFAAKVVGLGVLVDFCEEGSCIPHLVTWRSRGQNFMRMLLDIFRVENSKLGVKSTSRGVISDIELPIMGEQQWYETFRAKKDHTTSPATVDLLASARPKIYALVQLVKYRHHERVTIANEHYRIYDEVYNTDDQITMMLAENFLALKLGEVWEEVRRDLECCGIRPLAIDGQVVQVITQYTRQWSLHMKRAQEELLSRENEKNKICETNLYNLLIISRLSSSLEAFHEMAYVARATENTFRLTRKILQRNSLTPQFSSEAKILSHRTFLRDLNVSPVFSQFISIQSNEIVDPKATKIDFTPVSPQSDKDEHLPPACLDRL